MELSPPKRSSVGKPFALIEPGYRSLRISTLDGVREHRGTAQVFAALEGLKGARCYVQGRLRDLRSTTSARQWELSTWRGRETSMLHIPTGTRFTSLRKSLDGAEDPFASLCAVIDWLAGYGVGPGSISSMAWNLLRVSLDRTVTLGCDPELGRAAFYGPRQEARSPGRFCDMRIVDMRAAYPSAMAGAPYALSLREVSPSTKLRGELPGLARAQVRVPDWLDTPPLPVRVLSDAIQFQRGAIEGVWSWAELDIASQVGCDVAVLNCYAPRRTFDLFGPWWKIAQTGRELPGCAAVLAKAIANSSWSQFAMTGEDRGVVYWEDDAGERPYGVPDRDHNMPHRYGIHIAAETTARVRARLMTDVLYSDVHAPVHIDTDGVIIPLASKMPKNSGGGFGQWSPRNVATELDVRAPQLYRWKCPTCGAEHAPWHFVASGMDRASAYDYFRRNAAHKGTRIAFMSDEIVLPSCASHDSQRIASLVEQARFYGAGSA